MAQLDRNYTGKINLENGKATMVDMAVYTADRNIFNIKVQLMQGNVPVPETELSDYSVKLFCVKPKDNTFITVNGVVENDHYLFDMPVDTNAVEGTWTCAFEVTKGDEILNTNSFNYKINVPINEGLSAASYGQFRILGTIEPSPYDYVNKRIDEVEETAITDVKVDKNNVLVFYSGDKVVRKIYLNKLINK